MKKIQLFILFFVQIIFSCSKSTCDYSFKAVYIGLEKNPYKNNDTLYAYNGNNKTELTKQSVIQKEEKVSICGDGCVYGGACAQRYNMVTSYIDYNSIDNTKNIKIANTYYASDRSGLHYDVYHYIIDSMSFRLPSDYEYYPKNIDSLIIRNTMYKNVRELISQNSKSYIYINRNAKILRYVNKQTGDTLDFE